MARRAASASAFFLASSAAFAAFSSASFAALALASSSTLVFASGELFVFSDLAFFFELVFVGSGVGVNGVSSAFGLTGSGAGFEGV